MAELLIAESLDETYGTGETATRALFDVKFTLDEGEFAGIVGSPGRTSPRCRTSSGSWTRPRTGAFSWTAPTRPPSTAEERSRGMELLRLLGLEGLGGKRANAISGGQKPRVAIGRALMNRLCLILADEPTGNLDTANSAAVYALFREISASLARRSSS